MKPGISAAYLQGFTTPKGAKRSGDVLVSVAGLLCFLGLFGSLNRFWDQRGFVIFPAARHYIMLAGLLFLLALYLNKFKLKHLKFNPEIFCLALPLILFSDWLCGMYSLVHAPAIRGEVLLGSIIALALSKLSFPRRWGSFCIILAFLLLAFEFHQQLGDSLLISDDHAAMFYRLQLLKEHFPFIPFYNPMWNAGMDARDFFATGVLNIFFISFPLIKYFPVENTYNAIIILILFGFTPLMSYLAARLSTQSKLSSSIAALLSVSSSTLWYQWALSYGAMGFITAIAILPFNVVAISKLIASRHNFPTPFIITLAITITLMLFWSLTGIALLPLVLWGLISLPKLLKRSQIILLIFLLSVFNLPWIVIFLNVSKVSQFTSLKKVHSVHEHSSAEVVHKSAPDPQYSKHVVKAGHQPFSLAQFLKTLRGASAQANPLLIFLGIPGVFLLKKRCLKIAYLLLGCWLIFLATVIAPLKPQLELERMLLILFQLLCLPTAAFINRILLKTPSEPRIVLKKLPASLIAGFMFAGVCSVGFLLHNRTLVKIHTTSDTFRGLTGAIKQYGGDGRTVFSGFMLHNLDGSHISPLAYFSNHPLVASSPIHNLWWYTDVIPANFRHRQKKGIEEFLDLMNATAVVASNKLWRNYFNNQPSKYTAVWKHGSFVLYKRLTSSPGYFVSGLGSLEEQTTSYIKLKILSHQAVIKFTYYPFLISSACKLKPVPFGEGSLKLVGLYDCPVGSSVIIKSTNVWNRIRGKV